jgi:hypothetical protein
MEQMLAQYARLKMNELNKFIFKLAQTAGSQPKTGEGTDKWLQSYPS